MTKKVWDSELDKGGTVYLLASGRHGTLYIGVTSRLLQRMWEHREGTIPGFTSDHGVHRLVWLQDHTDITAAITREKQIKKWRREWKINPIESDNPHWDDLAIALFGFVPQPANSCHPREGGAPSPQPVVVMDPRLRGEDERK